MAKPVADPARAAEELLQRRRIRADFREWCKFVLQPLGQEPAAHHNLLIQHLEAVAGVGIDRLMVLMPPGSAKSTYASVLFPCWWPSINPGTSVIAASHTLDLAERFGRNVRNLIDEHALSLNYGIDQHNAAAGKWTTTNRTEYFAVGVGGAVTGRRGDLIVLDDPVASREAAESKLIRDRTWDWFRSDLYTRLKPGGRIVLIQTRWSEDDLAGRLLREAENGGDAWTVLKLPAIAGEDDPLGREHGEALWPEWQPLQALERIRAAIGERDFASLYQQEPRPAEGSLFKSGAIEVLDAAPPCVATVRAWDLASSAKASADWTVGLKLGRTAEGKFVVLDVQRVRGTPDQVEHLIVETAFRDGRSTRISLPKDPGQSGAYQVMYLTRKLAGFTVDSSPESGSKEIRAAPVASQANVGNLAVVRGNFIIPFLDELYAFPSGRHDDCVDALSRAFAMVGILKQPEAARRLNLSFMGR